MANKKLTKKIYLIVCSSGDLHEQTFQAGRAKYGAYHTRQEARFAAQRADDEFPGHKVITVPVPAGRELLKKGGK